MEHNERKPYVSVEIFTHAEQIVLIQPTPEFDGLELYIKELDKTGSGALYINWNELPAIINELQRMMEYVTK